MDTNERELVLKEEVYAVVGSAIGVLNVRGHGLHEKIYENCLCIEFTLRGIPYRQQERHRFSFPIGVHSRLLAVKRKFQ